MRVVAWRNPPNIDENVVWIVAKSFSSRLGVHGLTLGTTVLSSRYLNSRGMCIVEILKLIAIIETGLVGSSKISIILCLFDSKVF